MRHAIDQHQRLAGLGAAQTDLRRPADAAGVGDIDAGNPAQHVGEAFGAELLDFVGVNDRDRGARLADRFLDAIGSDDDFGQFIGEGGRERLRAGDGDNKQCGPTSGPRTRL